MDYLKISNLFYSHNKPQSVVHYNFGCPYQLTIAQQPLSRRWNNCISQAELQLNPPPSLTPCHQDRSLRFFHCCGISPKFVNFLQKLAKPKCVLRFIVVITAPNSTSSRFYNFLAKSPSSGFAQFTVF